MKIINLNLINHIEKYIDDEIEVFLHSNQKYAEMLNNIIKYLNDLDSVGKINDWKLTHDVNIAPNKQSSYSYCLSIEFVSNKKHKIWREF